MLERTIRNVLRQRRDLQQVDAIDDPVVAKPSDQELIVRVREARDRQAMAELYDRYTRPVYALALSVVREPRVAEDIAQDVFVGFWQRPDRYVPTRGAFAPWLLRVTRNRAIDVLRRRGREQMVDDEAVPLLTGRLVDPEPDVGSQVWERLVARELRGALAQLTEAQRQVIELAYFSGLSQSEMARQLNVPLGTIKSRVRSALQQLGQLMTVEAWTDLG